MRAVECVIAVCLALVFSTLVYLRHVPELLSMECAVSGDRALLGQGGTLFVCNHWHGYIDGYLVNMALLRAGDKPVVLLTSVAFLAWVLPLVTPGGVKVKLANPGSTLSVLAEHIRAGDRVVIFLLPEAVVARRTGAAALCRMTGCPLVGIRIDGPVRGARASWMPRAMTSTMTSLGGQFNLHVQALPPVPPVGGRRPLVAHMQSVVHPALYP